MNFQRYLVPLATVILIGMGLAIMGLAGRGDGGLSRRDVDLTALH